MRRIGLTVVLLALGIGRPHSVQAQGLKTIARLSVADGEVWVTRGDRDEQGMEATAWAVAPVGMTLEPGSSLATGVGRAEIAFADGSTMYLAENSLMSFGQLSRKGTATRGPVDLVSGTLSLDVHPEKGGWFRVTTPTDQMVVRYPGHALMRVSSYLDGMALMGFDTTTVEVGKTKVTSNAGGVLLLRKSKSIDPTALGTSYGQFAEWDAWVSQRIAGQGTGQGTGTSGMAAAQSKWLMPARAPRIYPRTVVQASLSDATISEVLGVRPLGFDRRNQTFVLYMGDPRANAKSHIATNFNYTNVVSVNRPSQNISIGGGPSAMREGKGGSLGRVDRPTDVIETGAPW